jgi:4-carboxymuconolactone decarboxylase
VTPVVAKEIVYQAVPYVGMAKVFDFIRVTNEVLTERGVPLPLEGQSTTTPETREQKGLAVEKEIVGADAIDRMYASASNDAIHFQHFLSANCFGDHYTRTGLDVRTRELLTFAMLVSLGGCDPQVKGHVAANLRVGNDRAARRHHAASAFHRVPPHTQRAGGYQRGHHVVIATRHGGSSQRRLRSARGPLRSRQGET